MPESLIHREPLVAWLLRGARSCASMEDCGGMVGISSDTIRSWLRRGKDAVEKSQATSTNVPEKEFVYAKFFADWTQARAEARVSVLEDLRDHHDWRAKVQWITRTSEDYKDVDKKQIEITGANGGPIEMSQLVLAAVQKLDQKDAKIALEKREEFKRIEAGDAVEAMDRSGIAHSLLAGDNNAEDV